jgi:prolyl 4-hydroxylase
MEHPNRPKRSHSSPLNYYLTSLFHGNNSFQSKNITQLHRNPSIYMVKDFLTKKEFNYFDVLCTNNMKHFQDSFTENDDNERVISEERSSKFIFLSKGCDKVIRSLEQKSAELVGLHGVNVEPIQVVSYTQGQRFNIHHDAGKVDMI